MDALVGRQTREHGDLDVFVDADAVPALLDWLAGRGYTVQEDWPPIRVELASETGRVDVHPMRIDATGDGVQRGFGDEVFRHAASDRTMGTIGGVPVVVAGRGRLVELRSGYVPRPVDLHDLQLLDALDARPSATAREAPHDLGAVITPRASPPR